MTTNQNAAIRRWLRERWFVTQYPHACRCSRCEEGGSDLYRNPADDRLYCDYCRRKIERRAAR